MSVISGTDFVVPVVTGSSYSLICIRKLALRLEQKSSVSNNTRASDRSEEFLEVVCVSRAYK